MNESEFLARSEAIHDSLESQAADWEVLHDIDVEANRSGNVLTLVFDNSIHVVINSQAPMQEMWVAARSGGFHYRCDGKKWNHTRGGPDMAEALSQICSEACGAPIQLVV